MRLFIYYLTSDLIVSLLIVIILKIFSLRTQSLVAQDNESLYIGQMHGKHWGGINKVRKNEGIHYTEGEIRQI